MSADRPSPPRRGFAEDVERLAERFKPAWDPQAEHGRTEPPRPPPRTEPSSFLPPSNASAAGGAETAVAAVFPKPPRPPSGEVARPAAPSQQPALLTDLPTARANPQPPRAHAVSFDSGGDGTTPNAYAVAVPPTELARPHDVLPDLPTVVISDTLRRDLEPTPSPAQEDLANALSVTPARGGHRITDIDTAIDLVTQDYSPRSLRRARRVRHLVAWTVGLAVAAACGWAIFHFTSPTRRAGSERADNAPTAEPARSAATQAAPTGTEPALVHAPAPAAAEPANEPRLADRPVAATASKEAPRPKAGAKARDAEAAPKEGAASSREAPNPIARPAETGTTKPPQGHRTGPSNKTGGIVREVPF